MLTSTGSGTDAMHFGTGSNPPSSCDAAGCYAAMMYHNCNCRPTGPQILPPPPEVSNALLCCKLIASDTRCSPKPAERLRCGELS